MAQSFKLETKRKSHFHTKTAGAALGVIFLIVAAVAGFLALQSWIVMLLLGGVAHTFDIDCAYGFWASVLIVAVLDTLGSFFRRSS